MSARIQSVTPPNALDAWWDALSSRDKGAVWMLMRLVLEMREGSSIELKRGAASFHVVDPAILELARLN